MKIFYWQNKLLRMGSHSVLSGERDHSRIVYGMSSYIKLPALDNTSREIHKVREKYNFLENISFQDSHMSVVRHVNLA